VWVATTMLVYVEKVTTTWNLYIKRHHHVCNCPLIFPHTLQWNAKCNNLSKRARLRGIHKTIKRICLYAHTHTREKFPQSWAYIVLLAKSIYIMPRSFLDSFITFYPSFPENFTFSLFGLKCVYAYDKFSLPQLSSSAMECVLLK
jgi:hypothetical protein